MHINHNEIIENQSNKALQKTTIKIKTIHRMCFKLKINGPSSTTVNTCLSGERSEMNRKRRDYKECDKQC